jgi:hypothetical protein
MVPLKNFSLSLMMNWDLMIYKILAVKNLEKISLNIYEQIKYILFSIFDDKNKWTRKLTWFLTISTFNICVVKTLKKDQFKITKKTVKGLWTWQT